MKRDLVRTCLHFLFFFFKRLELLFLLRLKKSSWWGGGFWEFQHLAVGNKWEMWLHKPQSGLRSRWYFWRSRCQLEAAATLTTSSPSAETFLSPAMKAPSFCLLCLPFQVPLFFDFEFQLDELSRGLGHWILPVRTAEAVAVERGNFLFS